MRRFKVVKNERGTWDIIDILKIPTCLINNKYTNLSFLTKDNANGYIYGKTGNKKYIEDNKKYAKH